MLRRQWPHATCIERASELEDVQGCDAWVHTAGRRLGIDIKYREKDCRSHGRDDVVIEIQSSEGRPGWALAPKRNCGFIVWVWRDSGRSYLAIASELAAVAETMKAEWLARFAPSRQPRTKSSKGEYQTTVVFVPIAELERCILLWRRGGLSGNETKLTV